MKVEGLAVFRRGVVRGRRGLAMTELAYGQFSEPV